MNTIMRSVRALPVCYVCLSVLLTAGLHASPSLVDNKSPDFAPFILDQRVECEDYNLRFGPVFVDIIGTFGVEYDTTSFAGLMDALLFTIRCAHTQIRQIKPAMARLKERNVDVSGLILNCVDTNQPGYYYYRYSEYYTDPNRNKENSEAANRA